MIQNKSEKHHRIVPIVFVSMALPMAVFGVFILTANALTHDEPAPDDRDLHLVKIIVSDKDNAWVSLQTATRAINPATPDDGALTDLIEGKDWSLEEARTITRANAAALEAFGAAATKPAYQNPDVSDPAKLSMTPVSDLTQVRRLARIAALEARVRTGEGNIDGAFGIAIDTVTIGHAMQASHGLLTEYLVGSAIKQMGLTAIRQIGQSAVVSADQAKNTSQKLESDRNSSPGQANAMKLEYLLTKSQPGTSTRLSDVLSSYGVTTDVNSGSVQSQTDPLVSLADDIGLTRFYYLPNQTLRYLIEDARNHVADAKMNCTQVGASVPAPARLRQRGFGMVFESNAAGKYLADIGRVSLGGISVKRCHESMAVSATQAILGLRAFTVETGGFPSTLDELVPTYLTTVPIDPFDGAPLRYVKETGIVYSVGPNRKDLGGSQGDDWRQMDNPTFTMSAE